MNFLYGSDIIINHYNDFTAPFPASCLTVLALHTDSLDTKNVQLHILKQRPCCHVVQKCTFLVCRRLCTPHHKMGMV